MTTASLVVAGVSIYVLYRTALQEARTRLVETAQSQARLLEAMARHDAVYEVNTPGGPTEATLSQIRDAHENYQGFGETGEFTLARHEGDLIVFLLSHRHYDLETPRPVPLDSELAEPMRQALSGQSGTMVGLDYRGEVVLAAYEPVAELDLGIVAKIDMAEIRAPFVRAGVVALSSTIAVVLLGTVLFLRISNPIIRRLEAYSQQLEGMVEERTRELEEAQVQLIEAERFAAAGRLAAAIAHEINNPMQSIRSGLELLARRVPDTDGVSRQYIEILLDEQGRVSRIIQQMLDFYRPPRGDREPTDVNDVIQRVLRLLEVDRSEVQTDARLDPELPLIQANADQLKQVFLNLALNAIEAMSNGGRLTITTAGSANGIIIGFTDEGPGIATRDIGHIFEPFYSTKPAGLGIGLSVSRSLIEAHGGEINVHSREGEGATFEIRLPVTSEEDDE